MNNQTVFHLKLDIYELGSTLAAGLLPVLEAYRDNGGSAGVTNMGKPVMAKDYRDPAVEKMIAAFKLLSNDEDPAELAEADKAVVVYGLLEFAGALAKGGLWM